MSFKIARFLAWRYVAEATRKSTIQTMVWVCLTSIFVGAFSLALILSIMSGFEQSTHAKLQGIYPDVIIEAPMGKFLDAPALSTYLKKEFPDVCNTLCTYSAQQVLVQSMDQQESPTVGLLKGIVPSEEKNVSALHAKFSIPANDVMKSLTGPYVLVGQKLAENLDLEVGDPFTILYNADPNAKPNDIRFTSTTATLIGLITTGIADYDNSLIIAHQSFIQHLFDDDCINEMGIKINPNTCKESFIEELKKIPDIVAYKWQDAYPSLVSALKLEKYVMGFLLGLIALVASMNNISLLFMFITSKRREIALLKTLGTSSLTLFYTFLFFNSVIATIGSLAGLIGAYGVGLLLQRYPFIELPDVYYVTHLPVCLDPFIFLIVFVVVLTLSLITALIPLRTISKINITQTLRFE